MNFEQLRRIGLHQSIISQLPSFDTPLMRVIEVHRDRVNVHDGERELNVRAMPGLAVGDWVLVSEYGINTRLEPSTHLTRRSSHGARQSLASNVDTALLLMGLDHDFNLRRLERYIALVEAAGIAPVVVLSKRDISAGAEAKLEQVRKRLPAATPIVAINGLAPQAAQELAPWLGAGQTLIMLGSSGAGKSTLTNTLTGSDQGTGGVRQDDSRGRHTTTARSLHRCPGGACIIDTPGLRSWQPDADEEQLASSFSDIEALARQCQFRDCAHGAEPGCAVREAVDPDRLFNYHKLLREARRTQQTALERIAERQKWKVLVRAVEVRNRDKGKI